MFQRFCSSALPFDFCHPSIEDLVYMHPSAKPTAACLLADLFVALEERPFSEDKVQRPGVKKSQVIEVPDPGEGKRPTDRLPWPPVTLLALDKWELTFARPPPAR